MSFCVWSTRWFSAAVLAGAVAATPVLSQPLPAQSASAAAARAPAAGGPAWTSLTPSQRAALGPLERDWASIDAPRKAKWLEVAVRFPAMPVADQQRVQQRMAEWARMTPAERGRARLSFQESKQFSPEQKQARWEAYQALPGDAKQALADRNRPADERGRAAAGGAAGPKQAQAARPAASTPAAKPVAPTMVQAKPGATTTLMTTRAEPPVHHRPGEPKIAAQSGQVDRSTLLPRSGPQAAASSPRQP